MAGETVSLEQQLLDHERSRHRQLAMIPLCMIVLILAIFLFGRKLLGLFEGELGEKLIFVAIMAALILGSYLLTGVFIPKQTAK